MENSLKYKVFDYVKEKYGNEPEFPWSTPTDYAVLRHSSNNKWYGVVMNIKGSRLAPQYSDDDVDILNIKADRLLVGALRMNPGYYQAYHMNKESWLSVILDGTVPIDEIYSLIDMSFELTDNRPRNRTGAKTTDWIVPSNPKMYDLVAAFEKSDWTYWSQSARISVGDKVYMYVGVPYSAIMFKCEALEVDLPANWDREDGRQRKMMKLKLLKKYGPDLMNKEVLHAHGVVAVRGARYMPKDLIAEIEEICP